jgi:hypothetical protein
MGNEFSFFDGEMRNGKPARGSIYFDSAFNDVGLVKFDGEIEELIYTGNHKTILVSGYGRMYEVVETPTGH